MINTPPYILLIQLTKKTAKVYYLFAASMYQSNCRSLFHSEVFPIISTARFDTLGSVMFHSFGMFQVPDSINIVSNYIG